MNNATVDNRYLKFIQDGHEILVSISSILDGGHPIDPESGEDLELASETILDESGNPT